MTFDPLLIGAAIGGLIMLGRWLDGPSEPIEPNEYSTGWINRRPPPPQGSGESDDDYAARLFAVKVAAEADRTPFYGRIGQTV